MTITMHNPQVEGQTPSIMPVRVGVIPLSLAVRRLIAEQFTPDTLRHLASLTEAAQPAMVARRKLNEASVDELAEMLTTGRKPTYGWWSRHAS